MRRIGILKGTHKTTEGTWYNCLDEIRKKPSVVYAEFIDTCSSSGEWSGVIIQRLGKMLYCHSFYQENNYPMGGFTIHIGETYLISDVENCNYDHIAQRVWEVDHR